MHFRSLIAFRHTREKQQRRYSLPLFKRSHSVSFHSKIKMYENDHSRSFDQKNINFFIALLDSTGRKKIMRTLNTL